MKDRKDFFASLARAFGAEGSVVSQLHVKNVGLKNFFSKNLFYLSSIKLVNQTMENLRKRVYFFLKKNIRLIFTIILYIYINYFFVLHLTII